MSGTSPQCELTWSSAGENGYQSGALSISSLWQKQGGSDRGAESEGLSFQSSPLSREGAASGNCCSLPCSWKHTVNKREDQAGSLWTAKPPPPAEQEAASECVQKRRPAVSLGSRLPGRGPEGKEEYRWYFWKLAI